MEFTISEVRSTDARTLSKIDALLAAEGIRRDRNLDYSCVLQDEDYNVIGTGSCYKNTLRCLAVASSHQGEGLMNQLISHLMRVQFERGNSRIFVYTKVSAAPFFKDLGFSEIASVGGKLIFLENRRDNFENSLAALQEQTQAALTGKAASTSDESAAIVMNADPFTNGHLYLAEYAAARCKTLHLFILSEDVSPVPFAVRKKLVEEGTAHLPNVIVHESGSYIISNATFPSYFLKDEEEVIDTHARLDAAVFVKIAEALGISSRYAGSEPFSLVTKRYNSVLSEMLPQNGIDFVVVPRRELEGAPISASTVRRLLKEGRTESIRSLVPPATYEFFKSPEAVPVLESLRAEDNVIHY